MQSAASVIQTQSLPRKYSRNNDDCSPNRQKLACMECQAVFYADMSMCTYCDSELKKITLDQARNCLNCGELIRKRCRKCPFCHYIMASLHLAVGYAIAAVAVTQPGHLPVWATSPALPPVSSKLL